MTNTTDSAETASLNGRNDELAERARKKKRMLLILGAVGFVVLTPLMIWVHSMADAGTATNRDGIPAVARVDRLGEGFCWVGTKGRSCVRLQLTVFPEGEEPFPAKLDVNVKNRSLPKVQPGSYVRVVRDRAELRKVYLNTAAFSGPAPVPPVSATPDASR